MPDTAIGPYQILGQLGAGGMGEVHRALDPRIGREVALKLLPESFANDPDRRRRFEQEARLAASLNHPNVMAIYDVGLDQHPPYIVSELVPGESLRAVIARGPVPVRKAVDIAAQIASGLAAAHAAGIVHRDLKPDNVLLGADGQIKLLDFGIAMDEAARRLTWFGLSPPMGTPDYMAPEQVRGRRGDVRTDVYALGTMLYEMIAGELPYSAGNVHAMMRAKLNEDPRPLREIVQDLDPKVEEIVMRAIARSPRERYPSAKDMLADLEDPSRVIPQDRSAHEVPHLLDRLRFPRRIVAPLVLALVIGTLLVLTWASGHSSRRGDPPGRAPIPPPSASARP